VWTTNPPLTVCQGLNLGMSIVVIDGQLSYQEGPSKEMRGVLDSLNSTHSRRWSWIGSSAAARASVSPQTL
jgi:hypothetical protein